MKIVKFYGGLGNQLFQYAMLVALRKHYNEEVLIDDSLYSTYNVHNGFELSHIFKIKCKFATKEQIKSLSRYTTNYRLHRILCKILPQRRTEFREANYGKYDPKAMLQKGNILYDGYWQHYEYFDKYKDAILEELKLKVSLDDRNLLLYNKFFCSGKSVSIHIRRGDYLKSKLYKGLCGIDYYMAAIEKAKEIVGDNADFIFFSNDMQWCKENLADFIKDNRSIFIDWNTKGDSYKDMILMSACRVNIIANSSFSWWSAYINKRTDNHVIAPKKWINATINDNIQLSTWILL